MTIKKDHTQAFKKYINEMKAPDHTQAQKEAQEQLKEWNKVIQDD